MAQMIKKLQKLPPVPEGISMHFFLRMWRDGWPDDATEWYNFRSYENIPNGCGKYQIQADQTIQFKHAPACTGYPVVEIPLLLALQTLDDEAFNLNPARWDRVKAQLSESECEHPWISVCESTKKPYLQDGRHRSVAMLILLGMSSAPFVVKPEDVEVVQEWVNQYQETL